MIKPDLIIRTNRRSLSLTISKTGELIVRAPKKLSMEYILNFIKEKESWIDSKKKNIEQTISNNKSILNYESFLFCGKSYKKITMPGKKVELNKSNIIFPESETKADMLRFAQNFYIGLAKTIIKERVEYFADLMQLNYKKIVIMDNKRRWGACMIDGSLKFNYRLCMLPHKVIDYIIIHELSHLLEFNHSPKFYQVVESVMPDWKKNREQLKTYDFVLTLLR